MRENLQKLAVFPWKKVTENLGFTQAEQYCWGTVELLVVTQDWNDKTQLGSQVKAQEGHSLDSVGNQR